MILGKSLALDWTRPWPHNNQLLLDSLWTIIKSVLLDWITGLAQKPNCHFCIFTVELHTTAMAIPVPIAIGLLLKIVSIIYVVNPGEGFHWTIFWIYMSVNLKQILSKDDVKSTVNVAKPGFTPFVSK